MSLPGSGTSLELARSLEMKNQRATQETFTRISFSGKLESFHEQLVGHSCVALQLAFQDDYVSTIKSFSILQVAMHALYVRLGHIEKDTTPFFSSFSVRATETKIVAVLDCAYATHGLYVCHPCSGISAAWTQHQIPCWKFHVLGS
jgi:hypothetical protein